MLPANGAHHKSPFADQTNFDPIILFPVFFRFTSSVLDNNIEDKALVYLFFLSHDCLTIHSVPGFP